jgi:hypothetical protein
VLHTRLRVPYHTSVPGVFDFGTFSHRQPVLMRATHSGFHGLNALSLTIKVQCKALHSDTGRGSSSIAEGALPYDVVHLAGGGEGLSR